MFSRNEANRPESKSTRMFRPVRQLAALGRSLPYPTASCFPIVLKADAPASRLPNGAMAQDASRAL